MSWLSRLLCSRKSEGNADYYSFCIECDNNQNRMMQKFEDEKIERNIKQEARRLFCEYQSAPTYSYNGKECKMFMRLTNPMMLGYIIYDDSAKFADTDLMKLVDDEFNRLLDDAPTQE